MAGRNGRFIMMAEKRHDRYVYAILPVLLACGLCGFVIFDSGAKAMARELAMAKMDGEETADSRKQPDDRRGRDFRDSDRERDDRDPRRRGGRGEWGRRLRERLQEMLADPERRQQALDRIFSKERLESLKKHNPELYELTIAELEVKRKVYDIACKYQEATGESAKEELRKELGTEYEKLFDLTTKRHTMFLEWSLERLNNMKAMLDDRRDNRDERLSEEIEKLLSCSPDESLWEWFKHDPRIGGPPPDGPPPDGGPPGKKDGPPPPREGPEPKDRQQ